MFWLILVFVFSYLVYYILDKLIRSIKVGNFAQKYVFITGCDSGFGKRLAVRLDGMGFPVFAGCLTEEGRKFFADNASSRLTTLSLDVTNSDSIDKALESVKEKLPQNDGLWAIVNNAGIGGHVGVTEFCTLKDFQNVCDVNLFGLIEMCLKFMPLLRKSRGRIVNMASIAGRNVVVSAPYCVSKFGVEAFSDSLRRELYHHGVKVSMLEPGFFLTDILNFSIAKDKIEKGIKGVNEEVRAAYGGEYYIENTVKLIHHAREWATEDIGIVVNVYIHAIVARHPRTRYVVGWDAKWFFVPLTYLPTGIADWILRKNQERVFAK